MLQDHMRPRRKPNREGRPDVKALQRLVVFPGTRKHPTDKNPDNGHCDYIGVGMNNRNVGFPYDPAGLDRESTKDAVHPSIPAPLVHSRFLVEQSFKMLDYRSWKEGDKKWENDHSDKDHEQYWIHRAFVGALGNSGTLSGCHNSLFFLSRQHWRAGCGHFLRPHFPLMINPGKKIPTKGSKIVPCTRRAVKSHVRAILSVKRYYRGHLKRNQGTLYFHIGKLQYTPFAGQVPRRNGLALQQPQESFPVPGYAAETHSL